jgi:hypothetical protein
MFGVARRREVYAALLVPLPAVEEVDERFISTSMLA